MVSRCALLLSSGLTAMLASPANTQPSPRDENGVGIHRIFRAFDQHGAGATFV